MFEAPSAGSAAQVATSADVEATLRYETRSRLSVEHFSTAAFDELSASSFAVRTVCVQMRTLESISMWSNGNPYDGPLERGCWQVHAPGDSFRAIAVRGYELVRFSLPESALEGALSNLSLNRQPASLHFIDRGPLVNPFLLNAATEIKFALDGDVPGSRLYVDSLFAAVLSHLIVRHSNLDPSSGIRSLACRGGLAPRQLGKLTRYLDENIAQDVSLAEMAAVCGMSTYHLCRAFRQSTGLPPHRWQIVRRMERAKDLLETSDRPVIDIAAAVGYADPSQFASMFRKVVGTSPTNYRRHRCS